jgi:hypothetical protein
MRHRRTDGSHRRRIGDAGRNKTQSESGAVLILAMVFLVAISMAIVALTNWTGNSLSDTLKFQNLSQRLYAAEGATQLAVRSSRYTYLNGVDTSNPPGGYICPGTSSPITINGYSIQDWCSTATFPPFGTITREITITACLTSTNLTANCTSPQALLTAVIDIDDISAKYPTNQCTLADESACGASMIIKSWNAT